MHLTTTLLDESNLGIKTDKVKKEPGAGNDIMNINNIDLGSGKMAEVILVVDNREKRNC